MRRILIALCVTLAACATDNLVVPAPPNSADLSGNWSIDQPSQPAGNQFSWSLSASDDQVTGTGKFAGEAGPFGTMTLHGSAPGDSLHLDIEFVYDGIFSLAPYTGHFDGVLTSRTDIHGILTRAGGPPGALHLSKVR